MTGGFKSIVFSCAVHGAAFAAIFLFSASTQGNDVVSASDPLLAMFADADADPTKAAGLVDELPGLAEGSPDGDTLEAPDFSDEVEQLTNAAEDALEKPLPEPEPEPELPAVPVVAKPEPAAPVPAKPEKAEPKKPEPKKTTPAKPKPKPKPDAKPSGKGEKRMSLAEFQKINAGKKPKTPGRGKNSGKRTSAKIDLSKIGTGSGSGSKRFGVPGGTGGNGGEGGRAVASAQQMYAAEIAQKLGAHLDNVLSQEPLTLNASVSVKVRLEADTSGRIRLLEVIGSNNPQVRDRVAKAVARIGQFRKPPEGRAFSISLPDVVLSPM